MSKLSLDIRDESKRLFQGEADQLVVPAFDGLMGIFPHHAPFIGLLKQGEVKLISDKEEKTLEIPGGLMEVFNNKIEILAFKS